MEFPKRWEIIAILTALSMVPWGTDLIIRKAYGQATGCLVLAAPRAISFPFTVNYDPKLAFPPEKEVRIYRSINKAAPEVFSLPANTRSYKDNTLAQRDTDTTYEYYATVVNDDGESPPGVPTLCVVVQRQKRPPPAPIMGPIAALTESFNGNA